jgi:hypothetical protein
MKLKELVKKLAGKPAQDAEVHFVVWTKDGDIVCADMGGPMTQDLMRVFAKHAPNPSAPKPLTSKPKRPSSNGA